jgi:hypothetical protein
MTWATPSEAFIVSGVQFRNFSLKNRPQEIAILENFDANRVSRAAILLRRNKKNQN